MEKIEKGGKMITYFLAWWNLENLFDIENYPERTDKLNRTLKNELKGWNQSVLDKKIVNLAEIINKMNNDKGPDILGVCEVENHHVLELLCQKLNRKNYGIVHADTEDERGIDVAFIYDKKLFYVNKNEIFSYYVMKRNATRDLLQVNFYPKNEQEPIVIIGNHWPSRSGGQYESEPYRMIAGETLAYYHQRIQEVKNENTPVIAMGDFNDEPHNRSVMEYALSVNSERRVKNAREKPYFYNLMWSFMKDGDGTHYYDSFSILDQIMISKCILNGKSKIKVIKGSCKIEKYPQMMKNSKPIRYGRPSVKGFTGNGYSDHFPISVMIKLV